MNVRASWTRNVLATASAIALTLGAASAGATPLPPTGNTFSEATGCLGGDASPNVLTPCVLAPGLYGQISLHLDDNTFAEITTKDFVDIDDEFRFYWNTLGIFRAEINPSFLFLSLETVGGGVLIPNTQFAIQTATPLPVGDYVLAVRSFFFDPPATAAIFNLTDPTIINPIGLADTSVPEPSTMILLGAGLVGLVRRRATRRSSASHGAQ